MHLIMWIIWLVFTWLCWYAYDSMITCMWLFQFRAPTLGLLHMSIRFWLLLWFHFNSVTLVWLRVAMVINAKVPDLHDFHAQCWAVICVVLDVVMHAQLRLWFDSYALQQGFFAWWAYRPYRHMLFPWLLLHMWASLLLLWTMHMLFTTTWLLVLSLCIVFAVLIVCWSS